MDKPRLMPSRRHRLTTRLRPPLDRGIFHARLIGNPGCSDKVEEVD